MGYGQDTSLIYAREEKEIDICLPFNQYEDPNHIYFHWRGGWDAYLLGFCGKIYPIIEMRSADYCTIRNHDAPKEVVANIYRVEEFDAFVDVHFDKKEAEVYHHYDYKTYLTNSRRFQGNFCQIDRKEIVKFFTYPTAPYDYLFRKYQVPCWSYRRIWRGKDMGRLTVNPILSTYGFQRIMGAYETHQEISMYLGGVLGAGNPSIPHVSNDDLIEAKGFDLKTSFRKPKA